MKTKRAKIEKLELPPSGVMYRRSIGLFTALKAIIDSNLSPLERYAAAQELPEYAGRGKGRGSPSKKFGNACKPWKYMLHGKQGKRECERRLKQLARVKT